MDKYIDILIKLANKSLKNGDVPVSAIVVENGKIISKAHNLKYKKKDVTAHAEILAIKKACKKKKSYYLNNCTLYVTLEPCMMCTAAIIQSHIKEVVYCVKSPKFGYLSSNNNDIKLKITECYNETYEKMLKDFFKNKR